jgi:EF-hand domain pair
MPERSPQERESTATAVESEPVATEESGRERYVGGQVPPVGSGGTGGAGGVRTASERAYAEDDNERELKQKVSALVATKFGGDYKKAFDHYDADHDGGVDKSELGRLLSDAGVGNAFTRGAWTSGIITKLDSSKDAKIEWSEFEAVFSVGA